jgi:hypothetical protein
MEYGWEICLFLYDTILAGLVDWFMNLLMHKSFWISSSGVLVVIADFGNEMFDSAVAIGFCLRFLVP